MEIGRITSNIQIPLPTAQNPEDVQMRSESQGEEQKKQILSAEDLQEFYTMISTGKLPKENEMKNGGHLLNILV